MIGNERHVVAIYPHPDDEAFGKAGTLALFTKQGTPVTLITGTLGEMGRNMGKPFFATRETLKEVRRKELRDACDVMGISDLRLLGLRDKTVEFEDPEAVADKIEVVLREVKPSLILAHYPEHGVHPDHDALARAVVIAVSRLPKDERPVIWGSPVTRNAREVLGPPDVELDVSLVVETKIGAIRAHASQSQAMLSQVERRMAEEPAFREEYQKNLSKEAFWIVSVD